MCRESCKECAVWQLSCEDCDNPKVSESTETPGYIAVPIKELKKLEEARKALYAHLDRHVGGVMLQGLTEQIWKVANTKRWK